MSAEHFYSFAQVIAALSHRLQHESKVVHSAKWQGVYIANKPEMATHEVLHTSFEVPLKGVSLGELRNSIAPNLPWADNHFEERVCGSPINPGVEWRNWPYGKSAERFLDEHGKFNHNYMERYWPRYAGTIAEATEVADDFEERVGQFKDLMGTDPVPNGGIKYEYGDLGDVVSLLADDPYTRQAYLPVWFPEDTGGGSKRAPCTIGYHFIMRDGSLDVNYHIRSCDFVRHFRDDCYLTVRLLLWVLERCKALDPRWEEVVPGKFVMQIGSLHIFRNDYVMLFGRGTQG